MSDHSTMTSTAQQVMRVLIVEDEVRYRAFLIEVLRDMGCDAAGAGTAAEAMKLIETGSPDVLVLDLNLPVMDGMTFLERFRAMHPDTPVVIITGFGDLRSAQRAIQFGVVEFLTKPCHLGQIELAIDRARRQLARQTSATLENALPPWKNDLNQGDASLAAIERQAILEALRANGGNRSAAAAKLGISRRSLYNKIDLYASEGYDVP